MWIEISMLFATALEIQMLFLESFLLSKEKKKKNLFLKEIMKSEKGCEVIYQRLSLYQIISECKEIAQVKYGDN